VITKGDDLNTGIFFPAADTIAFAEGGSEAARIDSSGKLLVGSSTSDDADSMLQIEGASTVDTEINYAFFAGGPSVQPRLYIGGNNTSSATGSGVRYSYINSEDGNGNARPLRFLTGTSLAMTYDNAGRVGIGTTNNTYLLLLNTDSAAKPSTNTWTVSSDERLKEDIELANLDICYEAIKNIPLKRFKWKDEVYTEERVPDRRKLGWIAQDVEAIFPKAVQTHEFKYGDEGSETTIEDCRDLNADQIYAAMYGAIQKLIAKVETLEAEVQQLKGQ
jgi:hypothetical protein